MGSGVEVREMQMSARNQLPGRIKKVKVGNVMTEVIMQVGDQELVAAITSGSAKRMKVYWNGALVASKTLTTGNATLADGTSPLTIGGSGGGENLVGKVDDFKLWNLTRSDADICASAGRTWNGTACY